MIHFHTSTWNRVTSHPTISSNGLAFNHRYMYATVPPKTDPLFEAIGSDHNVAALASGKHSDVSLIQHSSECTLLHLTAADISCHHGRRRRMIISIAPYLTDKGMHTMLYKINNNV